MVEEFETWDGQPALGVRSRGAKKIWLLRVQDNLLFLPAESWPHPSLTKVGQRAKASWFSSEDADALAQELGYISYLQSIDSEDAITWSFFGTLLGAEPEKRVAVLNWLASEIGDGAANQTCQVLLWSRHAHPHTGDVSHGPEMDFVLVGDRTVVVGEAKWRAPEGALQGTKKDRTQTQIREEYVDRFGQRDYPGRNVVLLALERSPGTLAGLSEDPGRWAHLTWERLATCSAHPLRGSFARYLSWKEELSAS